MKIADAAALAALAVLAAAASARAQVNYPEDVLPQHHDELSDARRKADPAGLVKALDAQRAEHGGDKALDGDARLAVAEITSRAQRAQAATGEARAELLDEILEIAAVYSVHSQLVLHTRAWVHPFFAEDDFDRVAPRPPHSSFAANLQPPRSAGLQALASASDRDRLDPRPSAFWAPVDLARHETYGSGALCGPGLVYAFEGKKDAPEEGGGRNPGFKASVILPGAAAKTRVSVKLAMRPRDDGPPLFYKQEPYVEATANALYRALGFNVDDAVFCPSIKVAFDEGLLTPPKSSVLDPRVWDLARYYDQAILRDGTSRPFAEAVAGDARASIAFLTTYGVSLEPRSRDTNRMIGWSLTGLSHEDRRELRALPLVDAWLGNLDDFGFNLKLALGKPKAPGALGEMRFVLSDLGMSFAPQYTILPDKTLFFEPKDLRDAAPRGEYKKALEAYRGLSDLEFWVNGFSWSVFQQGADAPPTPAALGETERMARVARDVYAFDLPHVQEVFPYVTWEDLRWGARKIAALPEAQILHAACLSGLGYPGARLLTEKLVARRDQLVRYFGLEPEIKLLRPRGPDAQLDASGDGSIQVRSARGRARPVRVPSYGYSVQKGIFRTGPTR